MVKKKKTKLVCYDLGCGDNKREGFTGVDKFKTKSVDILCDLFKFPWKLKSNSADEVHASHFFEHIPGELRGKWMDELYRIMKPGAKATIIVPYGGSHRAAQDFTHTWPPVFEESFLYFNKEWRQSNKLTHGHYNLKCDFDYVYGYNLAPDWNLKSDEAKMFGIRHYLGVVSDLQVTLIKK